MATLGKLNTGRKNDHSNKESMPNMKSYNTIYKHAKKNKKVRNIPKEHKIHVSTISNPSK